MTWQYWLAENWFAALQSLMILCGFIFTCVTLRRDERSRRITNLFNLTAHHRDIWAQVFAQPELRRVLSDKVNLERDPVSIDETLFVGFLVLHLNTAHQAIKRGLMDPLEGLGADIRAFFVHPIPKAVWNELRRFQDPEFIAYVEAHFHDQAEV